MEATLECGECGTTFKRPGARGPVPTRCPDCKARHKREAHAAQERARAERRKRGEYSCGHCHQTKSGDQFAPSQRRDGSWCRDCFRETYVERSGGLITKSCAQCGAAFTVTRRNADGKQYCSRACKDRSNADRAHDRVVAARADLACENCGKPMTEKRANARWCSEACAIKGRVTPEQRKRWNLTARLRQYGLTMEEFEAFMANGCAICGTHESQEGRALAIDHCHVSGKPRGVLCGRCNKGLGLFYDNPELLRNAADYIERGRTTS